MDKVLLIVPTYNESQRLDIRAFQALPDNIHVLFAEDGSEDGTLNLLKKISSPQLSYFSAGYNSGKANVIYLAFQDFLKKNHAFHYDWIGFWDADLATPLDAVPMMLDYLRYYPGKSVDAIWGSRMSRLGSHIKRQMHRHYLGRIFVTITSTVLKVRAYDSQCGAKLFRWEAAKLAFSEPFISRWIFDVEILLRLKNRQVVEFPLMKWEDIPGSKVKIFKEIFRVLFDLYKIRKTYLGKN
jgi:glycosyltransferase involved in cell wall biosynthesis